MRAGFKATECVESTKGLICEARALLREEGSAAVLAQETSTKSSTKLKSELTAGPRGAFVLQLSVQTRQYKEATKQYVLLLVTDASTGMFPCKETPE